jgi:hypothetical protein
MLDGVDKLFRVLMEDGLKGVEHSDVFLALVFGLLGYIGLVFCLVKSLEANGLCACVVDALL